MKILLVSHVFFPLAGGIETMSAALAEAFVRRGHSVRLVTQTPYGGADSAPYEVIRRPGRAQRLALARWCDVFFQNNISLQTLWPLLLVRRPWVVTCQTWITRADGTRGGAEYLKRLLLRYATSIAISQAVADHLGRPCVVIGNAYRDRLFQEMPEVPRERELIFLGRLVSDKGALLIEALGLLHRRGLTPRLTIVGTGDALPRLQESVRALGLEERVCFAGQRTGSELARFLNAHHILVVPSRWKEPFGIVALEGIACGCVVVGSEGGGLKEAIGPCGVTFPNGSAAALADALAGLLRHPEQRAAYRQHAPAHLARYTTDAVADAYLRVFENALR